MNKSRRARDLGDRNLGQTGNQIDSLDRSRGPAGGIQSCQVRGAKADFSYLGITRATAVFVTGGQIRVKAFYLAILEDTWSG